MDGADSEVHGGIASSHEVQQAEPGVVVIRCDGELDMSVVDQLVEAIEWSRTPELRLLRIDATRLTFVDSTGLGALMDAEARCRASNLRFQLVCGATLERLLDVMGAGERFRELVMQTENAPVSG
jgi:anti-anti-sigma factor